MNNLWSSLHPYWQISFKPSRAYLWTNLILWFGVWAAMTIVMKMIVKHDDAQHFGQYVRIVLDAVFAFLPLHFLLRPYLKLYAIPRSRIGLEVLPIALVFLLLSYGMMWLSVTLAKLPLFGAVDMSQMEVFKDTASGKGLQFVVKDHQLLWLGAINNLVIAATWAGAYWLCHAVAAKKAMQKQMHEAQLQQLTNQLNPHFLFNALNSIRALIYEDQDKAAHTVTQLSELFRHHLQAHLKPLSSLREEWQLASQYVAIEQIRFEKRLEVQCDLSDDCLAQQLPTLTLLTLVENAIKHGISPNARGGKIQLRAAKLDAQRWQLHISNTVGAPSREQSTRTGLANIRRRLELQHPQQRLQWVSDKESFSITLELVYDPNPYRG